MLRFLVVGLGGFVGAVARYGISGLVHRYFKGAFPAGTFVVNIVGCVFIGALMALVEDRSLFSPQTRLLLIIGLLGSFTTFSTVAFETFEMLRGGNLGLAFSNVTANVVVGVGMVCLGRVAVKLAGA